MPTHTGTSLVRVILTLNEQVGFCGEHYVLAQAYTAYSLPLSVPDKMCYLYNNKCLETFKEGIVCNSLETVRELPLRKVEKGVVNSGQAQWEFSLFFDPPETATNKIC